MLTFYAEYTESVLDYPSYAESTVGPPWVGTEKNFQDGVSQMAGNAISFN